MSVLPKMFNRLASQAYAANPGSLAKDIAQIADLEPGFALPLVIAASVGIPMLTAMVRGLGNSAEEDPEPAVPQEYGAVSSIFSELADARNRAATDVLDNALADLLEEQSWDECKKQLDAAVKEWDRSRPEGAGNAPDHDEMVQVLLSLVRNLREAAYRDLFAEHYRQVVSVDRRVRLQVEDVFVRLEAASGDGSNGWNEREEPECLDFQGLDAAGIEGRLRRAGNLVIIGEPGSGKSTMLRYLAAVCAASETAEPLLPMFLNLRDYAGGQEVLIAESAAAFAEGALQLKMAEGFFEDALRDGRCLVCLDALDEVPKKERRRVVSRVEQLERRYHDNNRFVVTSRRAGYDEEPLDEGIFKRYDVQPMDDDAISDFIDWRFRENAQLANGVRAALDDDSNLRALASNPLQLAMFNLVYREDDRGGLPLKRSGFYQKVVEELIEDQDRSVGSHYAADAFYKYHKDILAAIAHHVHSEERETVDKSPLLKFVTGFLEKDIDIGQRQASREAEAFVELAERRTGLLASQRASRGVKFQFLHATIQEYLTARHIYFSHKLDEPEAFWNEIEGRLTNDFWREVIVFLLAGFGEDEGEYCTYLTEKILAAGDETLHQPRRSELPTHLQLVADALADQAPMSSDLQQAVVGRLERLGRGPYGSNWRAIRALGGIRHIPDLVTPALTTIAIDPAVDDWQRWEAAEQLRVLGERETVIEALIAICTDRAAGAYVRVRAAEQLGELGEGLTVITALTAVADDPEVDVGNRVGAGVALAELGEREKAIEVMTAIAGEPAVEDWGRVRAAEKMGELGEREKAIEILTAITDGQAGEAWFGGWPRVSAAEKMGDLGEREKAIEALTTIIGDPAGDARERADAAEQLGELGEREKAIEVLTAIISNPTLDAWKRTYAAKKFGQLGVREKAIEALNAIAKDPAVESRDRVHTALDLRELDDEAGAKQALAAIAVDPKATPHDRGYAAGHLAALGERATSTAVLIGIATAPDVDAHVRLFAARDLEELGERERAIAIEVLTAIVNDPAVDASDRRYAARNLAELGQREEAVEVLTAIVSDPAVGASDRVVAAGELAELGEREKVIEELTGIATEPAIEAWDREYAAEDLSEMVERKKVIEAVIAVTNAREVEPVRRVYAAAVLGKLGEMEAAVVTLKAIANDPEAVARDRVSAAEALGRLGERDAAMAVLTIVANDPAVDEGDQERVAEAMVELSG